MTTAEAPQRIQEKIRSLLEMAAHPETPEHERALAQERAEKLMNQYKVERATLNWERPITEQAKPVRREFSVVNLIQEASTSASKRDWSEYQVNGRIQGLMKTVFQFSGSRVAETWNNEKDKKVLAVFGYEEDVFYGELLWNIVLQEVLRTMFPGWSPSRSLAENVYRLKNAGYSWPQIREMGLANGAKDHYGPLTFENAASKLRSAYGREAVKRGEPKKAPLIRDPHWWRKSFVDSFAVRLTQRMAGLKQDREEYFAKKNLPAIQNAESVVDEAFYEEFPSMRPPTEEELEERRKRREEQEEKDKNKKAVRSAKAPRVRYYDDSAWIAGHSAANDVDLSRASQVEDRQKGELE